jgi:hypothetical protein
VLFSFIIIIIIIAVSSFALASLQRSAVCEELHKTREEFYFLRKNCFRFLPSRYFVLFLRESLPTKERHTQEKRYKNSHVHFYGNVYKTKHAQKERKRERVRERTQLFPLHLKFYQQQQQQQIQFTDSCPGPVISRADR